MTDDRENVILIHGLWMTGLEMSLLRWRLRQAGFRTFRFGYPSLRATVPENAQRLVTFIQKKGITSPHLVCHSLGGLIGLRMMADFPHIATGRMVALGSPFLGSITSQTLARQPHWPLLLGKSLEEGLDGTGIRQTPEGREIGVIAGTASFGPAKMLRDLAKPKNLPTLPPNDGPIMVAETLLPGIVQHLTLPVCHMALTLSHPIADETIHFLRYGCFIDHQGPPHGTP